MVYRDKISGNVETIESGEVVTPIKLLESIKKTLEIVNTDESKIVIFDEGDVKNSRQFLIELTAKVLVLEDLLKSPSEKIIKK